MFLSCQHLGFLFYRFPFTINYQSLKKSIFSEYLKNNKNFISFPDITFQKINMCLFIFNHNKLYNYLFYLKIYLHITSLHTTGFYSNPLIKSSNSDCFSLVQIYVFSSCVSHLPTNYQSRKKSLSSLELFFFLLSTRSPWMAVVLHFFYYGCLAVKERTLSW